MRFSFLPGQIENRLAGIMALILSLVHGPLPQPDFHNIRHQDTDGKVCEYHDHLLRWHPGAGIASDVAVLHWHWFLPAGETSALGADSEGPAIHAHAPIWDAVNFDAPQISADTAVRFELRGPSLTALSITLVPFSVSPTHLKFADNGFSSPLGATAARGNSPQALLQRWVC